MKKYIVLIFTALIVSSGVYASYKCLVKATEFKVKREAILNNMGR